MPTEFSTQYPELATEYALTTEQRKQILDAIAKITPNMKGANVADVIAIQHDADDRLDLTEAMFDAHPLEFTTLHDYALLALSWIITSPLWEEVNALATAAALLDPPSSVNDPTIDHGVRSHRSLDKQPPPPDDLVHGHRRNQ